MTASMPEPLQDWRGQLCDGLIDTDIVQSSSVVWFTTAIGRISTVLLIKKIEENFKFVLSQEGYFLEMDLNHDSISNLVRGRNAIVHRPDRQWQLGTFTNSDLHLFLTTEWLNRPTLSIHNVYNEKVVTKFLIDPENRPYLNKLEKIHVLKEFVNLVIANTNYVPTDEGLSNLSYTFDQDDQTP